MRIYKIPLPPDIEDCTITGGDPNYGLFQGLPSNDPVKVLVRVYIVKVKDNLRFIIATLLLFVLLGWLICFVSCVSLDH